MPCARAAFDGGRVQAVDVQLVADFLEQAQLCLFQRAVGGGDVAGQRVGCLEQAFGQRLAHEAKERVAPVFLTSSAVRMSSSEAETATMTATSASCAVRERFSSSDMGGVPDQRRLPLNIDALHGPQ